MSVRHLLTSVVVGCIAFGLGIVCTQPVNPYLTTGSGELVFSEMPIKEGATLPIFSTVYIRAQVLNPDDIASLRFHCPANRLWSSGDTTIPASSFGENSIVLAVSIRDTGAQSFSTTLRRIDGDSVTTRIAFRSVSPLNQGVIRASFGDTVDLSTAPVSDSVVYVWKFPNGVHVTTDTTHAQIIIEPNFTHGIGELFIRRGSIISPSHRFPVYINDTRPPVIVCLADSMRGDTIFTGASKPTMGFALREESGRFGPITLDGREPDFSTHTNDTSVRYFWSFPGLDSSMSPHSFTVKACDASENCREDTFVLVYRSDIGVKPRPYLQIEVPQDSQVVGDSMLVVRGRVENVPPGEPLFVFIHLDGKWSQPITVNQGSTQFAFPAKLQTGLSTISILISRVPQPGIDTVARVERVVIHAPGVRDADGPVIVLIRHMDKELVESYMTDSASIAISVVAYDIGAGIREVTLNGQQASFIGNDVYSGRVTLIHGKEGNPVVVSAVDSAGNTTLRTLRIFKNSPPQVLSMPSVVYARALTPFVDSFAFADSDDDSVWASVRLVGAGLDTLLSLPSSGIFSWTPAARDTAGPVKATVSISDGLVSRDSSFIIVVQPPLSPVIVAAKFTIEQSDFPESLVVGRDSLRKTLSIDQSNTSGMYLFFARVLSTNQVLLNNTLDSILVWKPTVRDTGHHVFEIIVKSGQVGGDTLRPAIRVVMPPQPITVSFEKSMLSGSELIHRCSLNVVLSRHSVDPIRVGFEILSSSTARAGVNYMAPESLQITFLPGTVTRSIVFSILHDHVVAGSKTLDVKLSSATNAVIGSPSTASYIIVEADTPVVVIDTPKVSFVKADSIGSETASIIQVGLTLSRKADKAGSVHIATAGIATRNADYVLLDSVVNFAVGDSFKVVRFLIVNDTLCEPTNETIILTLNSASGLKLGSRVTYVYTILPSDADRCRRRIAYVLDPTSASHTDTLVSDSLRSWGYTVTHIASTQATPTTLRNHDLVFISQTISGATPGNGIANSDLPIVCANGEDYVKLGLGHATDTSTISLASVRIVFGNPIYSPFSADTVVRLSATSFYYPFVETPLNGIVAAVRNIDPARAAIFGFERGTTLINGVTTAARRSAFPMARESGTPASYTPLWFTFLRQTIRWTAE